MREELITKLAELIVERCRAGVLRVAFDGPDAAGKTTMADEVSVALTGRLPVLRAGIDGFHRPREERRRRGSLSPEGYYEDSFDYAALGEALLDPLGGGGAGRYRTAVFDHVADAPVESPAAEVPDGAAVLLFDGVFLLRPELRERWDLRVYVRVDEAESLRRAVIRDAEAMGGQEAVQERYKARYLPGQRLYRAAANPEAVAEVVIDNNDPTTPIIHKWPNKTAIS